MATPRTARHLHESDIEDPFASFIRDHGIRVEITPVYHLSPDVQPEQEIHQHHCVTLRTERAEQPVQCCMTTPNWDEVALEPATVLFAVGADVRLAEGTEGFFEWAEALDYDPDSRGVERLYRQTVEMAGQMRRLLGDEAYDDFLTLCDEVADALADDEDEGDDGAVWDGDET